MFRNFLRASSPIFFHFLSIILKKIFWRRWFLYFEYERVFESGSPCLQYFFFFFRVMHLLKSIGEKVVGWSRGGWNSSYSSFVDDGDTRSGKESRRRIRGSTGEHWRWFIAQVGFHAFTSRANFSRNNSSRRLFREELPSLSALAPVFSRLSHPFLFSSLPIYCWLTVARKIARPDPCRSRRIEH